MNNALIFEFFKNTKSVKKKTNLHFTTVPVPWDAASLAYDRLICPVGKAKIGDRMSISSHGFEGSDFFRGKQKIESLDT